MSLYLLFALFALLAFAFIAGTVILIVRVVGKGTQSKSAAQIQEEQ